MTRTKKIGKLLRGISEKESPKKVSIVQALDDACASGFTESERFSVRNIKSSLKVMQSLLDAEDFNRDAFFLKFFQFYTSVMAPDGRAKGVFHPSQLLDGCVRKMCFELNDVEPVDEFSRGISGALQRTFDVGTWYHLYTQALLYRLGLLEQAEVPVVNKEKRLNGKADGKFHKEVFGENVILEIKTMNNWNYSKAVFRPFKKHEFQASLYARELGATKVLYLYINKDTSEMKEFLMPLNEEQLAIADKKMDTALTHVSDGTLPPRRCLDKLCDDALQCPFASLCFKD